MAPRGNNGRLIRNDDGGPRPVIENSYNPGSDKGPTDNTAWLINNPDFDERPATIEEFLAPVILILTALNPNSYRAALGCALVSKSSNRYFWN